MTIEELRARECVIFECITGNRAYDLDQPGDPAEVSGVFIHPEEPQAEYQPKITSEDGLQTYYEWQKFGELLCHNQPKALELLCVPDHCVLLLDPLFKVINSGMFLSHLCHKTYVGEATRLFESHLSQTQNGGNDLMQAFRLLQMALEIGRDRKVIIRRPDRNRLLALKDPEESLERIVQDFRARTEELEVVYSNADLPEEPNHDEVHHLIIHVRQYFLASRAD